MVSVAVLAQVAKPSQAKVRSTSTQPMASSSSTSGGGFIAGGDSIDDGRLCSDGETLKRSTHAAKSHPRGRPKISYKMGPTCVEETFDWDEDQDAALKAAYPDRHAEFEETCRAGLELFMDWSGMDMPAQAMDRMARKREVNFNLVSSSDTDRVCQHVLKNSVYSDGVRHRHVQTNVLDRVPQSVFKNLTAICDAARLRL